jgi:GNAT superfamily N-acetyltransferase
VSDPGDFWVAVDEGEAVWLDWFCVAPGSRGKGVGGQLLDFTVERARASGARFLRLYAWDGARWQAAFRLYESRGFRIYQTRNRVVYRLIRFELELI